MSTSLIFIFIIGFAFSFIIGQTFNSAIFCIFGYFTSHIAFIGINFTKNNFFIKNRL